MLRREAVDTCAVCIPLALPVRFQKRQSGEGSGSRLTEESRYEGLGGSHGIRGMRLEDQAAAGLRPTRRSTSERIAPRVRPL